MIVILVHSLRHVLFLQTLFTCTQRSHPVTGITQRIKSEFMFRTYRYLFRLRLSYLMIRTD
jgi:hypothetical protein